LKSRPGVSSPTQYLAAQITEATDPRQHRPHYICWALWPGYRCAEPWQCQTENRHSLAPCRLPPVLAMEGRNRVAAVLSLELRRWSGTSHRQPTLGRPTNLRRSQARHRCRADNGCHDLIPAAVRVLILHHGRREILWIGTTSPRVPIGSLVNSQKPSAGRKGHDTTFATEIALRAISSVDFGRWAFEIVQPRRGRYAERT
jgi:hypothetical protein